MFEMEVAVSSALDFNSSFFSIKSISHVSRFLSRYSNNVNWWKFHCLTVPILFWTSVTFSSSLSNKCFFPLRSEKKVQQCYGLFRLALWYRANLLWVTLVFSNALLKCSLKSKHSFLTTDNFSTVLFLSSSSALVRIFFNCSVFLSCHNHDIFDVSLFDRKHIIPHAW